MKFTFIYLSIVLILTVRSEILTVGSESIFTIGNIDYFGEIIKTPNCKLITRIIFSIWSVCAYDYYAAGD